MIEKTEKETRYFAFVSCPTLGHMLGFITEDSYKHWLTHTKIILHLPRSLRIIPDMKNPNMSHIMIAPPIAVRTNQRKLAVAADAVELVAEVDQDESGNAFCKDSKDLTKHIQQLFSDYLKALEQWKIDLSPLSIPRKDIALPDNVTPLNPNADRPPR